MDKKFYVYTYIRANSTKYGVAGTPYYVGKGLGKRAWSKNHHVQPPSDSSLIQMVSVGMSEKDALQAEMLLIHLYGRVDRKTGCLFNRTDGGEKRFKGGGHGPETRRKMAAAKLGKKRGPNPPEWNERIAAGNRGKVKSPETCAKIAQAKMGQGTGKRPPEWCAAVSRGKTGKSRPDMKSGSEIQRRIAATRTGKKRGPYRKHAILVAM
jgi:hypothetical protein